MDLRLAYVLDKAKGFITSWTQPMIHFVTQQWL